VAQGGFEIFGPEADIAVPHSASELIGGDLPRSVKTIAKEKIVVPRGGIEPPTPAFSVQCSTN
jgi:hypothetical protein